MKLTISNQSLCLQVETLGAEMTSIRSADGTEYLWQGDPKYWPNQAPNLFPFIGRLSNGKYQYEGTPYSMRIHGFAAVSEFVPVVQEEDRLVLELRDNAQTYSQYPVHFVYRITYELHNNVIIISNRAENLDCKVMSFAVGGHPGFRVPIEEGESFEDYSLSFANPCTPDRIGFTDPDVLVSGINKPMQLEEGRKISLTHDVFDDDAIIMQNMDREITLSSCKSSRSVTVSYPDFPYLGLWHMPHTDAPYVCIEPWTSIPGRQDVMEELTQRSDMIHLYPDEVYEANWTISID